jgi:Uma2 family endonuclease
MSVMTAPQFVLPADRPLTVADLDRTPDDGCRYELDDGVLVVSPAPALVHQVVLTRLVVLLDRACPPEFAVVDGPGVEISEFQYRIPDLVVVRTESVGIADKSVKRPPVLAVEIASPSTALYDRNRKKAVYADFGIPAYWIVVPDPDQPSITAFTLAGGVYAEEGRAQGEERLVRRSPFPVEIVPADLVSGPWRRGPGGP